MKKHKKWGIGIVLLLLFCVAGLWGRSDKPPVKQIEAARLVISQAESINAEVYSHHLYHAARILYDSAMIVWKQENTELFFLRHYNQVDTLVKQAKQKAGQAIMHTEEVRKNTRKEVVDEITLLRKEMKEFEKIFISLPLNAKYIKQHAQGKLFLNEAEIAFEKGDYLTGRQKIRTASGLIRTAYQRGHRILKAYFKDLPLWQKQLREAIEQSEREKSYVIVVEKVPACCKVYYRGHLKYTFPVEFGKNWLGDKKCEGDYATPEGEYHVVKKLEGRLTRYYKALLIDYPNANDRKKFEQLKKNGTIPRHARPGSLIEIHGAGGRGVNWTNGCVALENEAMSTLYCCASKGCLVLIIGGSNDER